MNPHKHNSIAKSSGILPSEFAQLALWMAANFAGMVTAVLVIRGPFYRALAARLGQGRPAAKRPSAKRSLPLLAGAIIGSSKSTIESVFGAPRATAIPQIGVVVHPRKVFWHSDLWYYPLVRNGPTAMAINFQDEHATHVEFFTPPR